MKDTNPRDSFLKKHYRFRNIDGCKHVILLYWPLNKRV